MLVALGALPDDRLIASPQPPIDKSLSSGLRVVEIAHHDRRTAHDELPRRVVVVDLRPTRSEQFRLVPGEQRATRSVEDVVRAGVRDNCRRFCET